MWPELPGSTRAQTLPVLHMTSNFKVLLIIYLGAVGRAASASQCSSLCPASRGAAASCTDRCTDPSSLPVPPAPTDAPGPAGPAPAPPQPRHRHSPGTTTAPAPRHWHRGPATAPAPPRLRAALPAGLRGADAGLLPSTLTSRHLVTCHHLPMASVPRRTG